MTIVLDWNKDPQDYFGRGDLSAVFKHYRDNASWLPMDEAYDIILDGGRLVVLTLSPFDAKLVSSPNSKVFDEYDLQHIGRKILFLRAI